MAGQMKGALSKDPWTTAEISEPKKPHFTELIREEHLVTDELRVDEVSGAEDETGC